MAFLSRLDISLSGMMAQRLRSEIIGENIAKATITRTENGEPYRRQITVFAEDLPYKNINIKNFSRGKIIGSPDFMKVFEMTLEQRRSRQTAGVRVIEIVEDETPFVPVFDPTHPDADEEGYYYLPNVDIAEEQIDALAATRSHEANFAVYEAMLTMSKKALTIGK
ncbi:MAG: flagellar basal body rod protein FlgC [Oscillospiraceae bacterium]|nr:flagellar basal body rod protein FlgC [Oscillospiraceae bacterium]